MDDVGAEGEGDGDFHSPFSHVPAADAGPGPMQDGCFTYEKYIA